MLTFLKVLLFGTAIALTQEPVDLGEAPLDIPLEKPISAITTGAHLRVDISSHIVAIDIISRLEEAEKYMEPGCLSAKLYTEDGQSYTLLNQGPSASDDATELVLTKGLSVPTDIDFIKLSISSCKQVKDATITWSNYKM